jgi:hypothetical protein
MMVAQRLFCDLYWLSFPSEMIRNQHDFSATGRGQKTMGLTYKRAAALKKRPNNFKLFAATRKRP